MSDATPAVDEAPLSAGPPAPAARRLGGRLRQSASLSRAQTVAGLLAAVLSISGSVYGYVRLTSGPLDKGELIAHVREGRTQRVVPDATVEVLRNDAIVTTFESTETGTGSRRLREGTYRVRVVHPRYAPETRTVQLLAGQTSEIQFRLTPRSAGTASATGAPPKKMSFFDRLFD